MKKKNKQEKSPAKCLGSSAGGYFRKLVFFAEICILSLLSFSQARCQSGTSDDKVMQAYELRTNGKLQESKALLEEILADDPGHALANFEMARLIDASDKLNTEAMLIYCNRAIENDSGNALYSYQKAVTLLLKAYIDMHGNDSNKTKLSIEESCKAFQVVVEMKPDCKEALLYLVDIYANLPEELGGNREKAEHYQEMLVKTDKLYAARGKLILESENTKESDYWNDYISKNGETNEVLELLGRAYIMEDDPENAKKCFDKIIASDPSRQDLVLQLARGHLMKVMQDQTMAEKELPMVREYFLSYLNNESEKPLCVEAWCYGFLSNVEKFLGNQEKAEEYLQHATELLPEFSRAFAMPTVDDPPDNLTYVYSSFFRPF